MIAAASETTMQSAMMFALGLYRFSVYGVGVGEFQRQNEYRWPDQEVIGSVPPSQWVGPGKETIALKGEIFPHYRGGLGQVDAMRAQAGLGTPLSLVDGTGEYYGDYTIEKIGEGKTVFMADGAPRKIEFDLKLKLYA